MSNVIPKERQTAYQRWELTSFGDKHHSSNEKQQEANRVSQAEIDAIKQQAREQAYAEGYKEAYELGFVEGREAGYKEMQEQAQDLVAHFENLTLELKKQIDNTSESIGTELIQLALTLASRMTKRQLEVAPEAIAEVIQETIELLPAVHQPASIYLHPDDCELMQELGASRLQKEGWRLQSDHQLNRGGCRIETAQNTIDASVETRWHRLTEKLLNIPYQQESL